MKCKKEVKCKEGSTTNLHNHLKRHHDIQVKLCPPKSAKLSSTSTENNRSPQQRTLLSTWTKLSRDSARHKSISQAVVQYIVQDMRPLDSVNDPGFINLIPVLEPRYDLENIPWLCSVLHGMSSPRSSASENDEELGSWSLRAGTNCTYLTL